MQTALRLGLILTTLATSQACAKKLKPDEVEQDAAVEDLDEVTRRSGKFAHSDKPDGSIVTVVDATDDSAWQKLDLDTALTTEDEREWDISFMRSFIHTNGGASGPGGVYLAQLKEQAFDDVTRAPDEGFAADRDDTEDDTDSEPDNVFNSGDE